MNDDRDMDGIPDRIDSSYTSPEELLEIKGIINPVYIKVDKEKLSRLADTNIRFCIRKTDDNYCVICDKDDIGKVRAVMNHQAHQSKKVR